MEMKRCDDGGVKWPAAARCYISGKWNTSFCPWSPSAAFKHQALISGGERAEIVGMTRRSPSPPRRVNQSDQTDRSDSSGAPLADVVAQFGGLILRPSSSAECLRTSCQGPVPFQTLLQMARGLLRAPTGASSVFSGSPQSLFQAHISGPQWCCVLYMLL